MPRKTSALISIIYKVVDLRMFAPKLGVQKIARKIFTWTRERFRLFKGGRVSIKWKEICAGLRLR